MCLVQYRQRGRDHSVTRYLVYNKGRELQSGTCLSFITEETIPPPIFGETTFWRCLRSNVGLISLPSLLEWMCRKKV